MSALASVIDSDDPEEIDEIIREGIPDPVGSFYRFSLAGSLMRRGKRPGGWKRQRVTSAAKCRRRHKKGTNS